MSVVLSLGTYPTPIERHDALGLWIKRDDTSAPVYGGNKVRKLERHLALADAAGKSRILTIGAAGSHQVVATTLYASRAGMSVEAVLVPQPDGDRARRNLRVALGQGLVPIVASSWSVAPALSLSHIGRDKYFIPLGGSDADGSLGFVDAAKEVAAQVAAGVMPEPDVVVVAMGSGGTAAGLAVGFQAVGMRTRVVGVAISHPASVLGAMARLVARNTAAKIGLSRRDTVHAVAKIEVDKRWIGKGYGHATAEGQAALVRAESAGITVDPTYTAKALACALARSAKEDILFWHTLSTRPLEPLLASAPELPSDIATLFR